MATPEITAIVNLHKEGTLAKATFSSLGRAEDHALAQGHVVEVLLVLDRPDQATRDFVAQARRPHWRAIEIDVGDLGQARNAGVASASGELVAFLDADDLWGDNWLTGCIREDRMATRIHIWHPEINIYFGASCALFHHIDMESDEFDMLDLTLSNMWTALACTRRKLLLEVPYPKTDLARGVGYEDWGWNLQTIQRGYLHKIVPGTGHAIRVKQTASLLRLTNQSGASPYPSMAFMKLLKSPDDSKFKPRD